jgi:hypothetical protein
MEPSGMSTEQTMEMWKEYRRRRAALRKGPADGTAQGLVEWNKEAEALEAFKKQIEALEDR